MNPKKEILDDLETYKKEQYKLIYSNKKNKDKIVNLYQIILFLFYIKAS